MTFSDLVIRDETPGDYEIISELTVEAFKTLEISSHTEQFIVLALRKSGKLSLSLVAEHDGEVVGHIAFSPLVMPDGTVGWYGLGPVSVLPAFQGQGIGKTLINEGLSRLKLKGGKGCCLVGHPEYYPKFGFIHPAGLGLDGVPAEVFFALAFNGVYPQGNVVFDEAFTATGD